MPSPEHVRQLDQAIRRNVKGGWHTIYLLQTSETTCKIGCTERSADIRRFELKLGNAHPCPILAAIPRCTKSADRHFQARFEHLWIERESFRLTPEILAYFSKFAKK